MQVLSTTVFNLPGNEKLHIDDFFQLYNPSVKVLSNKLHRSFSATIYERDYILVSIIPSFRFLVEVYLCVCLSLSSCSLIYLVAFEVVCKHTLNSRPYHLAFTLLPAVVVGLLFSCGLENQPAWVFRKRKKKKKKEATCLSLPSPCYSNSFRKVHAVLCGRVKFEGIKTRNILRGKGGGSEAARFADSAWGVRGLWCHAGGGWR